MKKIILILFFIILSPFCFADQIKLGNVTLHEYYQPLDQFFEVYTEIIYDTNLNSVGFISKDIHGLTAFLLDDNAQKKIKDTFFKYLEWEKKAVEKKVEISKEITSLNLPMNWMINDNLYIGKSPITATFTFKSLSKENHQLYVNFSSTTSSKNEFISYKMESLYINIYNVENILNILSKENMQKKMEEYKKQQQIEAEFK